MKIAVCSDPAARFGAANLGNGLNSLRGPLRRINDMDNYDVEGFIISDRSVCDLMDSEKAVDFKISRLDRENRVAGSITSVKIVIK